MNITLHYITHYFYFLLHSARLINKRQGTTTTRDSIDKKNLYPKDVSPYPYVIIIIGCLCSNVYLTINTSYLQN